MLYRAPSLSLPPSPARCQADLAGGSPCGLARRSVTGPWPVVTPRGKQNVPCSAPLHLHGHGSSLRCDSYCRSQRSHFDSEAAEVRRRNPEGNCKTAQASGLIRGNAPKGGVTGGIPGMPNRVPAAGRGQRSATWAPRPWTTSTRAAVRPRPRVPGRHCASAGSPASWGPARGGLGWSEASPGCASNVPTSPPRAAFGVLRCPLQRKSTRYLPRGPASLRLRLQQGKAALTSTPSLRYGVPACRAVFRREVGWVPASPRCAGTGSGLTCAPQAVTASPAALATLTAALMSRSSHAERR